MRSKECFKCNETKPLSEFYKHKGMADGHLNKCKACTRADSSRHRMENIEEIRAYDRRRGNRQPKEYVREYRKRFPNKYRAHTLVNNQIRAGNLVKEPCEVCGSEVSVAHHDDYSKPLNVRWLCQEHHKQWHAKHGEALNP